MKSILIIEDDDAIRESLETIFSDEGYRVLSAANGKEGLNLLRDRALVRPTVILLDLTMPVMSGREFLSIQKNDPELSSIPTIVFTAAGNQGRPELADDFLKKPIQLDDLLSRVEQFCMA